MDSTILAITWLTGHFWGIVSVATTAVTVASVVCKLTPSKADDEIVDAVLGLLHAIALNPKADQARPGATTLSDADKVAGQE
jgi:hypothetical protein